jgi:hypothetical protein
MSEPKLLQYNVQKSKDKVTATLLTDPSIYVFDIIALQEPWQNPFQNSTYCPSQTQFFPAYNDSKRCSCFLINKRLDITYCDVIFLRPDCCSLQLRTESFIIWIHNIYS